MKRLQCKYCGAPITEGASGKVTCPYCGSIFLLDELLPMTEEAPFAKEQSFAWQCLFCDAGNPEEAEFCLECGCERIEYQSDDEEKKLGDAVTSEDARRWLCPGCGTLNALEVPFCSNCGEYHLERF